MKSNIKIWKLIVLVGTMFFLSDVAHAKNRAQDSIPGYKPDTGYFAKRFIHRLGVEYRPGYIFQQEITHNGSLTNGVIQPT